MKGRQKLREVIFFLQNVPEGMKPLYINMLKRKIKFLYLILDIQIDKSIGKIPIARNIRIEFEFIAWTWNI